MMKKISEKKFSDDSIGEYYATGDYENGFPSMLFFWKGNNVPTKLCLNTSSYAYTHAGKVYQEACDNFPVGYSQEGGDAIP